MNRVVTKFMAMALKAKVVIGIVVIGILAGIAALIWPRPCTPDKECADYINVNNSQK